MTKNLMFLPLALLVACGIPGDTPLLELTADDAQLICDRAVDPDAADRTVTCEFGDVEVAAAKMEDCLAYFAAVLEVNSADCTATLDTWVACKEEPDLTDDQICGVEEYVPSEDCTQVATCVMPAATM